MPHPSVPLLSFRIELALYEKVIYNVLLLLSWDSRWMEHFCVINQPYSVTLYKGQSLFVSKMEIWDVVWVLMPVYVGPGLSNTLCTLQP